ncbi:hypothetical protein [Bradyrhizobium sp. RT5a]|uniref:hypothetical protein n=1 Tax=Bradyrhizobium sp. RT5a TaxID=3156380 RepID=UPI003398CBB8
MNSKRSELSDQYKRAAQHLNETERKIAQVSDARLRKLLGLSAAERLKAIDDTDLVASDRNKLRNSLLVSLRPKMGISIRWRFTRLFRRASHSIVPRAAASVILIALAVPSGIAIYLAWSNTGTMITVPSDIYVEWMLPSGEVKKLKIAAGHRVAVVKQLNGSHLLRYWLSNEGYATARVNLVD